MRNSAKLNWIATLTGASALLLTIQSGAVAQSENAAPEGEQEQVAATAPDDGAAQPASLTEEELEILVARIALYPDELVALISAASLYPLQIVEAARFLEDYAKDSSLEPRESWDESVISLLNYPEIVTMMSNDLDWTQALADAITYQQQDVLIAIQQLRDQAVANGVIESGDQITIVEEGDNIIIESTETEVIYVPQYEPEMLYTPGYTQVQVVYSNPYPHYYYPTAPFWAGFLTGAIWAAAVDWNSWGVWGGSYRSDVNIDIECNNCFNNREFNGNINWNDVDWKNIDRDKISIDRDQIANIDKTDIRNNVRSDIKANPNNNVQNRATNLRGDSPSTLPSRAGGGRDVRASTLEGLKQTPAARPATGERPRASTGSGGKATEANRRSGKPKAAAKPDKRSAKPSALGNPKSGKTTKVQSKRGQKSKSKHVKKREGGGKRGGGRRR